MSRNLCPKNFRVEKHGKRMYNMRKELEIGSCGLACCLCSENDICSGCDSGNCPDAQRCECRSCSNEKGFRHCYDCTLDCRKGILSKIKPYAFTLFVKRYGEKVLLDCLLRNKENGIIYHKNGINGDYDDFNDIEKLIAFILTGRKEE